MQRIPLLILLAALSFIPTLAFHTVGEEGIYTISSLEMWISGNWLSQPLYNQELARPPLMNWLVLPVAQLIGWSHVLIATRTVTILATLGMAGWLYWLTRRLFDDRSFALFATLACLSLADLLLYRGWLAYTDPTFAFFTFGAVATLWRAVIDRHRGWLLASVALISCAMLSKAFTAYVFYATAALVLFRDKENRRFLLSPASLATLALLLLAPLAWLNFLPHATSGHGSSMMAEILRKLSPQGGLEYLARLVTYPLETALWLSPAVLLALYLLWRKRVTIAESQPAHFRSAVLIGLLSIAPYWLAPQGGIRYLLPAYPLIALVCARIIWRAGEPAKLQAQRWFAGVIAFKFVFALALFPYYQSHYRGVNYAQTGADIMLKTEGQPLYTTDVRSVGLNVVSFIDAQRYPRQPVLWPPVDWNNGFVISMSNDPAVGKLSYRYQLAADELFVLCRGTACPAESR